MKHSSMQKLRNQLKKICNNENIVDIVIFGSFVKEKENANDIDIAVIFERENYAEIQKISLDIKKNLKEHELHIEPLIIKNLFKEPLFLTLIHEGFSIKNNQFINKTLKTESMVLVTYSLKSLNHSKKTLFGYALKGRIGQKGFIDGINGQISGRNNILVPTENYEQLNAFLKTWNVETKKQRFLKVNTII